MAMTEREYEALVGRFDRLEEILKEAMKAGSDHRLELDRRITRLEEKTERFITWKHVLAAATGSAGGAGALVLLVQRLVG